MYGTNNIKSVTTFPGSTTRRPCLGHASKGTHMTQFKSLTTNICTTFLQVSQLPLHMFRLQQAIFSGSKFYICSTADSGDILIHWELRICFMLMYEVLIIELRDVECKTWRWFVEAETYVRVTDLLVRI
jgi:hypothetical protein